MLTILTIVLYIVLVAVQGLNILGLPANWIMLALVAAWKYFLPETELSWLFLGWMAGLAAVGEVVEFGGQFVGSRKSGGTTRGDVGGFVGGILGAIVLAPFLLGLGALVGALAGAYVGCLAMEMGQGRPFDEARRAAWGAFWGRFFGLVAKLAIGMTIFIMLVPKLWPA